MRSARGFTLLEVMISVAIIGGLLVTVLSSLNYHLGIAQRHEFVTAATFLARGKLTEAERTPSSGQGDFPAPYTDYHYNTEVKASPWPGISEIHVTVSRGNEKVTL